MSLKAILFDLSGVLYLDDQPVPGALDCIRQLQQGPWALRFVTNTSRETDTEIIKKLDSMGFDIGPNQLFTAPSAVRTYLKNHDYTVFPLVHEALDSRFTPFTSDHPDTVLISDAGDRFDYTHLNNAFRHLMNGAELLAIGDNRYFRRHTGELLLDAGPFVHALEYATGQKARVLGKPAQQFFQLALDSVPCDPEEALMIGDDWFADVEGAMRAGMNGCLVRSGKYREGDEHLIKQPCAQVVDSLSELLQSLEKSAA